MSLSLPRRVLLLQYSIARLPLQAFESVVISRLDATGGPRTAYQQIVGTLDSAAGSVLGSRELAERGEKMRSAAADLARAARLEEQARRTRETATARTQRTVDEAAARAKTAEKSAEEKIADAAETELDAKVEAGTKAATRLADRKARADDIADKRMSAAEAQRDAALAEVERRENEAEAPRRDEIAEATDKLEEATAMRQDAERLADVAEASARTPKKG